MLGRQIRASRCYPPTYVSPACGWVVEQSPKLIRNPGAVESYPRIFDRADGKEFDYVINCACDSKATHPEEVYQYRNYALSMGLSREAAKRGVRAYVEASTAFVYKGQSKPNKEDDKKRPWWDICKWKLKVEEDLHDVPGLNWVSLRFPHVYGEYDTTFTATLITISRTYQYLGGDFQVLHSKSLNFNTIKVTDAARALWTAAVWRDEKKDDPSSPRIFNVVDHAHTTRGRFADAIAEVFGVKVSFVGTLMSQFAIRGNIDALLDDMNGELLQAWAELLEEKGITRPGPIAPFIGVDLLSDMDLNIDGSLFETCTGFRPEAGEFTPDTVRSIVASYERLGWWPS